MLETSNENFRFAFDRFDVYDWYLRLAALSNANRKYFHGTIPTWNNFVAHNSYDEFWKKHAVAYGLKETTVPNLNVAGWWDQEDFYGPMFTYENLEKSDTKHLNYLVVGPWNHGGWAHGPGNSLGAIPLAATPECYFRQQVEAPWFAYWLKDKGQACRLRKRCCFKPAAINGRRSIPGRRRSQTRKSLFSRKWRLCPSTLRRTIPPKRFDSYVSDPAHPVPYRHRPVDSTYPQDHPGSWYTWLVQDQRFVDERPDVLTWQTGELKEDVTIAGQVTAKLFASTTGTDSDWVVKLIDVYPENMRRTGSSPATS